MNEVPPRPDAFLIAVQDATGALAPTFFWVIPSTRLRKVYSAYARHHRISYKERRLVFNGRCIFLQHTCEKAGLISGDVLTLTHIPGARRMLMY